MHTSRRLHLGNFRWLALSTIAILVFLVVFSIFVPVKPVVNVKVRETVSYDSLGMSDDANAVTSAITYGGSYFMRALDITEQTIVRNSRLTANTMSRSGQSISRGVVHSTTAIGTGTMNSLAFVARSTIELTAFLVHAPGTMLGYAADTAVVNAVIKPVDKTSLPIIEATIPGHLATKTTITPIETVSHVTTKQAAEADWPIHGEITTLFGVPHWPFQPTHSGIDISDGRPSGVTPIRPFKPGVVTGAVQSYRGLGNHVTVDHGDGVKSVYAHLASITVQTGQTVSMDTVLGFEGSTGASTGTHLHFEIWDNGKVQNPLHYIKRPL